MSKDKKPIVAYVHDLSPIKESKSNKREWYDMTLQTEDQKLRAVCFSKAKRKLLESSQETLTPVKISNYLLAPNLWNKEQSDIKINEMTTLQIAQSEEYHFQYQQDTTQNILTLSDVQKQVQPGGIIPCIQGKITKSDEIDLVGKNNSMKMMKAAVTDTTHVMTILLWQENIPEVETGGIYQISNVRVRIQDGMKVLTTTPATKITVSNDDTLENLSEEDAQLLLDSHGTTMTIQCDAIQLIEKTER